MSGSGGVMEEGERGGGGEEEERKRGDPQRVMCPSCKEYTSLYCQHCRVGLPPESKINVEEVEHMNIADHQVVICKGHFTDYSRGEDVTSVLKKSHTGDVFIKKAKTLNFAPRQTVIYLDHGNEVQFNAISQSDFDHLEDASDGVLLCKTHWKESPDDPQPFSSSTEVLLTKFITEHTSDFFLRILEEILKKGTPEKVVRNLYNHFRLRLLGLTKNLDFLLEVEAEKAGEVIKRGKEIQRDLSQFLPEDQRSDAEWGGFARIPVQYTEDLEFAKTVGVFDVKEDSKETIQGALNLACKYGNYETVKRLLRHKNANIQEWNSDGKSLFHVACCYGQFNLLDILQKEGAAIHEQDKQGCFPLHLACGTDIKEEGKRLKTLQWLLSHGADVGQKNSNGFTPLELARMGGYRSAVELLMKYSETG